MLAVDMPVCYFLRHGGTNRYDLDTKTQILARKGVVAV
jgi:hypothetical protein